MYRTASLVVAAAAVTVSATPALAGNVRTLDLEGLAHGTIANRLDLDGVRISADNFNNDLDLAVVFDTRARHTADRDLEDRYGWKAGNLRGERGTVGNVLILQEKNRNTRVVDHGTRINRPDDEGKRPAGELYFDFEREIDSFGFDLIDVEGTEEFRNRSGFFATFTRLATTVSVSFAELINPVSPFYDATVRFGDNSANRIRPITAAQLGLDGFDNVTINLGGSGAVGNISYTPVDTPPAAVPTPSAAVAGLGLLGLLSSRRRRQS